MIKISDWMSKPVICAKPQDLVISSVRKMMSHDIGCLIVKDGNNKVIGILTERDILKKAIAMQKGINSLKVKDIMTKKVSTIDINSSILQIMQLMKKGKFRDTPITKNGRLVGIITSQDVIKMLSV